MAPASHHGHHPTVSTEPSRLTAGVGAVLRHQRHLRSLRQQDLADLADVSQAAIARIERGERASPLPMLEKVFAALDLQLRLELEPLDAHVDAALDRLAGQPVANRIAELQLVEIADRLGDIPFVFDGPTAALLQGTPLPGEQAHLAMTWAHADAFTAWLGANYGRRWHQSWETYGFLDLDPRAPGAHRWATLLGELTVRMVDELPPAVRVQHGDHSFQVVPLPDLEVADARTAELLQRHRARLAAGGPDH